MTTSIKMNQFKNKTTIKTNSSGNNAATETNMDDLNEKQKAITQQKKITKQHISCSKAKINSQHRASSAARKKRTKNEIQMNNIDKVAKKNSQNRTSSAVRKKRTKDEIQVKNVEKAKICRIKKSNKITTNVQCKNVNTIKNSSFKKRQSSIRNFPNTTLHYLAHKSELAQKNKRKGRWTHEENALIQDEFNQGNLKLSRFINIPYVCIDS